jgi:hypothetical protein
MEWLPAISVDVENVAFLVDELTAPVPSVAVPSLNKTVPLTAPPWEEVTVAVNVIVFPVVDGFREEIIEVVDVAFFTVCVSAGEVLPLSLALPA